MKGMKKHCTIILIITLLAGAANAQTKDAQLWTGIGISKKITKEITGSLEQQMRLDHNISFLKNIFTEVRLSYRFNKTFKYTASYRFINRGQIEGGFAGGNRFTGDLRIRWKKKPVVLTYRNRMQQEIRSTEVGVRQINYNRNKLDFALDLDKKFAPFVSFEIYYHLNKAEFNKNRYTAGVEFNLKNRNELSIWYRLQQEYNQRNPAMDYIIGIGFSHSLKGRMIKKNKKTDKESTKT